MLETEEVALFGCAAYVTRESWEQNFLFWNIHRLTFPCYRWRVTLRNKVYDWEAYLERKGIEEKRKYIA